MLDWLSLLLQEMVEKLRSSTYFTSSSRSFYGITTKRGVWELSTPVLKSPPHGIKDRWLVPPLMLVVVQDSLAEKVACWVGGAVGGLDTPSHSNSIFWIHCLSGLIPSCHAISFNVFSKLAQFFKMQTQKMPGVIYKAHSIAGQFPGCHRSI